MVDLAGFAGFDHQAAAGAQAFPDQVVVEAGRGQQGRDRCQALIGPAVGEDQKGGAVGNGADRGAAQVAQRLFEAAAAVWDRKENRQHGRAQIGLVEPAQLCQTRVGQNRAGQQELAAVPGRFLKRSCLPRRWWFSGEVTSSSRIASSGGLVTWANSCLK